MADQSVTDKAEVGAALRAMILPVAEVVKEACEALKDHATLGEFKLGAANAVRFTQGADGTVTTEIDTNEPSDRPLEFSLTFNGKPPAP